MCTLKTGSRGMPLQLLCTMHMSTSLLILSRVTGGCGTTMEWQLHIKMFRLWSMLDPWSLARPSTCNTVEEDLLAWLSTRAFDHPGSMKKKKKKREYRTRICHALRWPSPQVEESYPSCRTRHVVLQVPIFVLCIYVTSTTTIILYMPSHDNLNSYCSKCLHVS